MWEGVDLMHQVCLYLRAMCVLGVVNQDTSLETVQLMGWVGGGKLELYESECEILQGSVVLISASQSAVEPN